MKSPWNVTRVFKSKLDNQLEELETILMQRKISEGVIHQLRVNIKRWRVFFDLVLLSGLESKTIKHNLKDLKILFKSAGELRSIQLISKKLNSRNHKRAYLDLKDKISLLEQKLISRLKKFDFLDFKNNVKNSLCYFLSADLNFLKNLLNGYEDIVFSEIKRNLSFDDDNQIHSVRKHTRKVLDACYYFPAFCKTDLYSNLKMVQKKLGLWHDELDFSNFLQKKARRLGSGRKKIKFFIKKSLIEQQELLLNAKKEMSSFLI